MIIAFEGPPRCGISTQIKHVVNYFSKHHIPYSVIKPFNTEAANNLLCNPISWGDPVKEVLILLSEYIDSYDRIVSNSKISVVLVDRWWYSLIPLFEYTNQVSHGMTHMIARAIGVNDTVPDKTIYYAMPSAHTFSRSNLDETLHNRYIAKRVPTLIDQINQGYDYTCEWYEFSKIDATLSKSDICLLTVNQIMEIYWRHVRNGHLPKPQ